MPRAAVDLDRFRQQIEKRLLVDHQTQKDVVNWLKTEGISVTIDLLKARCKEWGLSRRDAAEDPNIIDRIYERFHTTTENDSTIANRLGDEGLSISARQVKRARLKYG
jgi:hypothetical protein